MTTAPHFVLVFTCEAFSVNSTSLRVCVFGGGGVEKGHRGQDSHSSLSCVRTVCLCVATQFMQTYVSATCLTPDIQGCVCVLCVCAYKQKSETTFSDKV